MKKVKRILAAAGAILLLLLYASTLVCALSSSENFMNLLMVSIYATVIIPVLLWAYTLIYKLVHKSSEEDAEQKEPPQGQGKAAGSVPAKLCPPGKTAYCCEGGVWPSPYCFSSENPRPSTWLTRLTMRKH